MKKMIYATLASALTWALALSCVKTIEEDAPEVQRERQYTAIEAYYVATPADATKTDYEIDMDNRVAHFSWVDGDHIDAIVTNGSAVSSVVFTKQAGDSEDPDNHFLDGQLSGEATLAEKTGFDLGDWAFYPSSKSPEALDGGFQAAWSYESGAYKMQLPVEMTFLASKPLAVVPLVGKKDADGKYGFYQMTGVLAIPVTNLPDEADYISIHSDNVAFAGTFNISEDEGVKYIAAREPASDAEKTLTLNFSGLEGEKTFYFSVPVGVIPAGLVLTVGSSTNDAIRMVRTTNRAITVKRGQMIQTPAMEFTAANEGWTKVADAEFLDDFIWGQHAKYTANTRVPVELERSSLNPDKYRINNPYTVANDQFGYTPYTEGVTADAYFVFYIESGVLRYGQFRTGVEDRDSGGRPMMITYSKIWSSTKTGSETKVISFLANGLPLELQFGAVYSQYENPADYMYTRDGEGNSSTNRIHLWLDVPETWDSVGTGTFIDHYIWEYEGLTDPVEREIYQNSHSPNRFRIAKPYPAADADEWFEFDVTDPAEVTSVNYYTGTTVSDETNTSVTWKAVVWNPGYASPAYSNVISTQANGFPKEVQIGPCYRDSDGIFMSEYNYDYEVGKDHMPRLIDIVFPDLEETWTSLGTGRFEDTWIWNANVFAPYAVEVEIWRSNRDANRYRVTNPYHVAATAFRRTEVSPADEYMYLSVASSGQVVIGELVTGMSRGTNTSAAEYGYSFAIADGTTWGRIKPENASAVAAASSKVLSGSASEPETIQLVTPYFNSANLDYYYTSNTGTKTLWFPGVYRSGESWTDFCEGTYKDNTYDAKLNGSSALGTVPVTIQQSTVDENRFRIANPYLQLSDYATLQKGTADDYLYFQYGYERVYFELFHPGIQINDASKELVISHPVDANIVGYTGGSSDFTGSSILSYNSFGTPTKIQLGAYYYDKYDPGYCYTRGGNAWSESDRIVIGFTPVEKADVSPYFRVLKPSFHNPVANISLPSGGTLERMVVKITGVDPAKVKGLRLYDGNGWMDSDYVAPDGDGIVTLTSFVRSSYSGSIDLNFWMDESVMGACVKFEVTELVVSGESFALVQDADYPHFFGAVLNTGGNQESIRGYGGITNETIASFRIPALVTSKNGTLIAAYDIRYDNNGDLQGDIDVGYKRSTDGGKTWSSLGIAMDMGTYGYTVTDQSSWKIAQRNNGIGDPCLLSDDNTGDLFCFAVWTNGHYDDADHRSLAWANTGYEISETPQFMMVKSTDDGLTWSEPINVTSQMKQPDWRMTFQGPGRGITMKNGTLVIPIQHQEGTEKNMHSLYPLNSGIAYSTDHGETWHAHNYAHPITSESAVAEIEEGVLMLSMRDETDSHYRRVFTTTDLGMTWTEHSSNGTVYEQSACEASLIHVDADKNILGQDLLLMSNPQGTSGWRSCITIQASLDKGATWTHRLLVDPGGSLGYSCLTMIDESTVGILLESSLGDIVFFAIPLTEIVK